MRTALITGTSRPTGIGFAVARQLAERGHHVILTARDLARAEPLAAQLRDGGHRATARDTPILVNSVDPGETATHPERGDEDTARPAADSARGIVWAATLPHDGPTGGFFLDGRPL